LHLIEQLLAVVVRRRPAVIIEDLVEFGVGLA